jgi:hypothetical protein
MRQGKALFLMQVYLKMNVHADIVVLASSQAFSSFTAMVFSALALLGVYRQASNLSSLLSVWHLLCFY